MSVVSRRDDPHVSYPVRTPAEKPGHDVLALPVSAFVQVPGVLPNFQPLFECEFERNVAAFGAVLVLIVFLFPFAHAEPYWLRIILTRCRDGGTEDDRCTEERPRDRDREAAGALEADDPREHGAETDADDVAPD